MERTLLMNYPVSDILRAKLAGEIRANSVGAEKTRDIGDGGNAGKSAPRHQPDDREETNRPMRLRQGTLRETRVPFLKIIDGGKR